MTLLPQMVGFWVPKSGNSDLEWEDGAAMDPGDLHSGRPARAAVADGASAAYSSRRWADHLVSGFTSTVEAPATLGPADLVYWLSRRQERWDMDAASPANFLEQLKVAEGSFATFLGCVISGLDGAEASWEAAALGDSVLFHLRGTKVAAQVPPLSPVDFGRHPNGADTRPQALEQMAEAIVTGRGSLCAQDCLFLATDAMAEWIVRRLDEPSAWSFLARVSHPQVFTRFVAEERAAGMMTNDDVTLVRVSLRPSPPKNIMVCR